MGIRDYLHKANAALKLMLWPFYGDEFPLGSDYSILFMDPIHVGEPPIFFDNEKARSELEEELKL